jgi:hypothetical protein
MKTRNAAYAIIVLLIMAFAAGCAPQAQTQTAAAVQQAPQQTAQQQVPATQPAPAEQAAQTAQAVPGAAESQPAPAQAERQSYNQKVFDQPVDFKEFPTVLTATLEESSKYSVHFETDQPLRFVVYSEKRYNEWKTGGYHTISKMTTNSAENCCRTDMDQSIDINQGEGGKYYFVFDAGDLKLADPRPTKGVLRVIKTTSI